MQGCDYHPAYYEGLSAAAAGVNLALCPYGFIRAGYGAPEAHRENSQLCKRMWWLAGYYDQKKEIDSV